MKEEDIYYRRAFLAGICISIGGNAFIKVGGIAGAFLFSFGLLSIIHFKLPLYTGMAGFFDLTSKKEWARLFNVLTCNVAGCFFIASIIPETRDGGDIIFTRIDAGYWQSFASGIMCGIIMTLIVKAARDKNVIPLLLGITVFIVSGYYHSVADAFYAATAAFDDDVMLFVRYVPCWVLIAAGNFVGCNVPRLLFFDKFDKPESL